MADNAPLTPEGARALIAEWRSESLDPEMGKWRTHDYANRLAAAISALLPREDADLDVLAEALANTEDGFGGDGCFDRIREWESSEEWQRQAHPDNHPGSDYEDREHWRRLARTAWDVLAIRSGGEPSAPH